MTDIATIFATDPENLTNEDIDAIVASMRSMRHQFNAGNVKAGTTKVTAKETEAKKIVTGLGLDIKI